MTTQVGPVPPKTDNNAGLTKAVCNDWSVVRGQLMMARPQLNSNECHKEAGYTLATIPTRLELTFVSTCGRSPYTPC